MTRNHRAWFSRVRVHDLKHMFGRRLRAAGVPFEDRQDLLGHKSSRITTHYSAAEGEQLDRMHRLVAPVQCAPANHAARGIQPDVD